MQDKELYQQILGLSSPWKVTDVELDRASSEIRVKVDHPRGSKFCCPECKTELPCHDHAEERRWRHLDSCQFKTILIARPPRVNCPEHGVKTVSVPWAEKSSRFTLMFVRFAIDVLLAAQTVEGACVLLRTTWDEAFRKGQNYITLIYNLDQSTVEAISDGNDTEAANAAFSQLSEEQLGSVQAIAMDMSAAYVKSAKANIPLAEEKIVHDRFHIMKMANEAVDKVRKAEHRELKEDGDNRLTGTKFLWLTGTGNLSESQRKRFDAVYTQQLKTGRAWGYKEVLRDPWQHRTASEAIEFFKDWYNRVIHTNLEPLKVVARSINERLANVVSYCTHGITNAVAEGINSKIMAIKRRVGGYRNRENFKTAIFFYCGGLDLYPR